ncbi:solute carrier family 25 member 48 [Hyalella azteca]|uniref:Solute carrier family 25 member 48 n=1 Tax=Hyalella azteca TaxID=294128 RepID=A0A8B7N893_HYAAZ|nr:solute carrier family 25 member 48 [Hyalella azteca]
MNTEVWCDFVAGWIGGCAGLLVGHPMDTIKVRQQALGNVSAISGISRTFKYEGVLSVACPVDLVKIKMQLQTEGDGSAWGKSKKTTAPRYGGPTACLLDLYRTAGLRGCYYGLGSMAIRDVPSFGYYMVIYEMMIRQIAGREDAASPATLMFCGGMAGAISWMTIVPIDVIKSRVQADDVVNPQYKNFWDCCVKSYKNEGLSVFTRGFSMVILRALPTNGAIFLGYVTSMNLLRSSMSGTRESRVADCASA